MSNCVYIMTCDEFEKMGLYKIGKSKKVSKRYSKTSFPSKPRIVYSRAVENMKLAEDAVHHFLRDFSYEKDGGKEWFMTFNVAHFISVIDTVCAYIEAPLKIEYKSKTYWEWFKNLLKLNYLNKKDGE